EAKRYRVVAVRAFSTRIEVDSWAIRGHTKAIWQVSNMTIRTLSYAGNLFGIYLATVQLVFPISFLLDSHIFHQVIFKLIFK
ncbi:MAG: hypothetical protein OXC82_07930, partial [Rhodobacteraceae bacterium]|nr:hypothetical protein [Paracoccaceae bacterium]